MSDFSGYHYPTSQLQLLDRSPTATPVQTRSGSPPRGKAIPHTVEEATDFMSKLNDLMGPSVSSEPNAAEEPAGSDKPTVFTDPDEKLVLKSVSATDGSATVSTSTKVKYLTIYFAFNLGLTLFNKAIMIAVCVCADVAFFLCFNFLWERFCGSRKCYWISTTCSVQGDHLPPPRGRLTQSHLQLPRLAFTSARLTQTVRNT